jgi:hypothetical protein
VYFVQSGSCCSVGRCECDLLLVFCIRLILRGKGGSCDIAVSVSNARFCIQSFFLECRLHFGSFCSNAILWSVNVISVLWMTLGWKSCFRWGVIVCDCINLLSLLSSL